MDMWTNTDSVEREQYVCVTNLDPDSLADIVPFVDKHAYNPSLHDIMGKYYEMFRDKNDTNKKDFFNSPDKKPRPLGPGLGHTWVN
jgi:hypothetical protein